MLEGIGRARYTDLVLKIDNIVEYLLESACSMGDMSATVGQCFTPNLLYKEQTSNLIHASSGLMKQLGVASRFSRV